MERKEQQGETLTIIATHRPMLLGVERGHGNGGEKLSLERGEERCCFNVYLFVVHIKIYFDINIVNIIKANENYSMYVTNTYLFTDGKY